MDDTDKWKVPGDDEVDETPEAEGVKNIEAQEAAANEAVGLERAAPEALPNRQLSDHFKLSEFHSKDGVAVPDNTVVGLIRLCVDVLEPLRTKFGRCEVNSGFRSKNRNQKVGGATRSYHRYDLRPGFAAADVNFKNGNPAAWFAEADRILGNAGGAGRYATFVHVDNRDGRWRK